MSMKISMTVGMLMLPLAAWAQQPAGVPHPATEAPSSCTPSMGLSFVCGLNQPEDLLQIGGSKWVIASAMGEGGGISIIDTEAKTARRFFTGVAKPDKKTYPDCTAAPASTATAWRCGRQPRPAPTHSIPSPICRSKASRSLPWMRVGASPSSAGRAV
jgi:hypothetical protein